MKTSFCKNSKLFGGDHGWVLDESKISEDSVIYSVGVGSNIDFDIALIKRFNLVVHAFDPTPRSIEWVENQSITKNFKFYPLGLGGKDGTMNFFPRQENLLLTFLLLRDMMKTIEM